MIVGVFYVITQYVGTIGSGGPNEIPFDFAALGEEYVGRWLGILVELAVILDILAVGIGFAAATSRAVHGGPRRPVAACADRRERP